jgi:hypothetical protein
MQVCRIAKRGDGMVATGRLAGDFFAALYDHSRVAVAGKPARTIRTVRTVRGLPARVAQGGHLRGGEEVSSMRGGTWE